MSAAEADWEAVKKASEKGRPKTAQELCNAIYERALGEDAWAEATKALAMGIAFEGQVQGNKSEEKILRLQKVLPDQPLAMQPVLEGVLGYWYWEFFKQNRWRFLQRTQTAGDTGDDLMAWDLKRIFQEIDTRFSNSLQAKEALQGTDISDWDGLLVKGSAPDQYRPTLYDFLAQQALDFYAAGEQAGARPQDAFEFSADTPIFGPRDAFLQWKLETTDVENTKVKAISIFQELIRFHQDDEVHSALLDVDLQRLKFGNEFAFGENREELYGAALKQFSEAHEDHELFAMACYRRAKIHHESEGFVQAHEIATQGKDAFPKSFGGVKCHQLIEEIEAPSSEVSVERVWNAPWSPVEIHYKNLTKAYFRIYPLDFEMLDKNGYYREYMYGNKLSEVMKGEPVKTWSIELEPTLDFEMNHQESAVPEGLEKGLYLLVSSHTEDFGVEDNLVNAAPFWVSDLALITRVDNSTGSLGGFVLEARSGEPIEGVAVQAWERNRLTKKLTKGPSAKTDEMGAFSIKSKDRDRFFIDVVKGKDRQVSPNLMTSYSSHPPKEQEQVLFFTDRALYRPGQTVHFKGLCISVDTVGDDYKTVNKRSVEVVFRDGNGKEIAKQTKVSNAFGSFSGNFTAPRDRLMGRMSIAVIGKGGGQAGVQVEEYKRPKFKVELEKPEIAPRLSDEVTLVGVAKAYTGAAIDGAEVSYRIVREVHFPIWWRWCFWWHPPNRGESQEIANGTAKTGVDGSFKILFNAVPDLSISEKEEPTFRYVVYADVTDGTGETRSGEVAVQVGYTALKASLTAENWQEAGEEIAMKITTETLDGMGQTAKGDLKVYRLKSPEKIERPKLPGRNSYRHHKGGAVPANSSDPNSWELGEVVFEEEFETESNGIQEVALGGMDAGFYRALLETSDRFGKKVTARLPLRVVDPLAEKFGLKVPELVDAPKWTLEPGDTFQGLWGSGYDEARALIEIVHRGKWLKRYWTDVGKTQAPIELEISEAMRGGVMVVVTMVRENRAYLTTRMIEVPWTNKKLTVKWEHLTSTLDPGQKDTWTAVIEGPDAEKAAAEMVATLYDASLDAFQPHHWPEHFSVFRKEYPSISASFGNQEVGLRRQWGRWIQDPRTMSFSYRRYPKELSIEREMLLARSKAVVQREAPMDGMAMESDAVVSLSAAPMDSRSVEAKNSSQPSPQNEALSQVSARTNLNETAFFFPHLTADESGKVRMEFTMPEALTEWKFFGFAHDGDLRAGFLEDTVITKKDLMVQPNPPRFLRESDELAFTVKVLNQSPTRQSGTVRLTLKDARTLDEVDVNFGNTQTDVEFDIPAKESRSFSWRLAVPDGEKVLIYKAVATTGKLSDGEEGYLPVLSRRMLVTESLPLPIRGAETKAFTFEKLKAADQSDTLKHESLTIQMASNPAWYAVMALPYIMESTYVCSEQVFNRYYANGMARHIANSDPKIRRIFDQWKGTEALDSPLEKNQDLKGVLLEETPWLRQSTDESEARRNVGLLFDSNLLDQEAAAQYRRLGTMQKPNGSWSWFPEGPGNAYMTLYITTGFGRMRHLGVENVEMNLALKALPFLDNRIDATFRRIKDRDRNHLTPEIAFYLYGRSFFLGDLPVNDKHKAAVEYFLDQAEEYWVDLGNRQSQAHVALALQRFDRKGETPKDITISLKERSVEDEELGRFWRDLERSSWWYRAPIESQAMMIEVFDEVAKDAEMVEACKVWLLKQKQTQDWKTTKATADAVYSLLLRGTDRLASTELVTVTVGEDVLEPATIEAGTGFFEERFAAGEIRPEQAEIKLEKVDEGVAWGSVHWQYLEDMDKITPHEGTPLTLKKALFVKENSKSGPVLKMVEPNGSVRVGDELVTRIELRTDRDLEYVHLKDQRGSGVEPVNVISQYKTQDGLRYYESTRDTASHFFIDYLPKGTYVFEYSVRVQHEGAYSAGIANIQCMYAPEFNSHSAGFPIDAVGRE